MIDCKLPRTAAKAPAPGAPSWIDPRAIMAQCAVKMKTIVPDVAAPSELAPADPKRVAIGFLAHTGNVLRVGVGENVAIHHWVIPDQAQPAETWFSLFDYGPLVNLAWSTPGTAGADVLVIEVYRLT